jgi:dipeptide transport system substrate-binding protein
MRRVLCGLAVLALGVWSTCVNAKTLVFCSEGNPEYFTPGFNATGTSFDVTGQIYDRLISFEQSGTQLRPSLAQRWTVSNDGLTYVFSLRRGVKWHSNDSFKPTREFNADDVLFTLQRQWKVEHPFHNVTRSKYPYFESLGFPKLLKSIQKLDDYTVEIVLSQPDATFVSSLAMQWAGMQSYEYAQTMLKAQTPERFDQAPIATGPFQFERYRVNNEVVFRAFDPYWEGRTKLDQLIFSITPDASVRWQKIKDGACHVMPYPNPTELPEMRQTNGVVVLEQTGVNIGYMAYNTSKKPFDDVRVRRALNMAIDTRKILRQVYKHTALPATNPIPPIQWGYNRDIHDDVYSPNRARALPQDAGYPNGFSADLWAMDVQRPYMPNGLAVAKLIQEDLAEIGVLVSIKTYDWSEYTQRMRAGEHDMGLYGWTGDNGDPDNFLNSLLSCDAINGNNLARFCDASYDALVKKAKASSDVMERVNLYAQAQEIFKDQAPWLTIAHANQYKVLRSEVKGFYITALGRHWFYGVDLMPPP